MQICCIGKTALSDQIVKNIIWLLLLDYSQEFNLLCNTIPEGLPVKHFLWTFSFCYHFFLQRNNAQNWQNCLVSVSWANRFCLFTVITLAGFWRSCKHRKVVLIWSEYPLSRLVCVQRQPNVFWLRNSQVLLVQHTLRLFYSSNLYTRGDEFLKSLFHAIH